jgi:guanosine-3',5'-bis(diphosphate) 3'-pyrophosphohydrolase
MNDLSRILDAASFAAQRHRDQRRKDIEKSPYINHPLSVARLLSVEGNIKSTLSIMRIVGLRRLAQ